MSIASEILRIQQAKQAIKESINDKGGTLTNESIDVYAQAVDNLPSGGGGMTHKDYARTLYLSWSKSNQFEAAWNHSLTVDPLAISAGEYEGMGREQYPNFYDEGIIIPQGVTSIGGSAFVGAWYDHPLVIPNSVTSIGYYAFAQWHENNHPLVIPQSVTSIYDGAFVNWQINTHPLIIPDSVISIGYYAFGDWWSNNQPLVISNSVTSIGSYAFHGWASNNQPLVIPSSVLSIESGAFFGWQANTHPLVIPQSVTSIYDGAFFGWESVPYVEMKRTTPPTLVDSYAFDYQNDAPIYVPHNSVTAYKTATNWVELADRIFSINDK